MNQKTSDAGSEFRALSAQDFLNVGLHQVAFIKPMIVENRTAFAIHAADGTPLSVAYDMTVAMAVIRQNDMEPATIQ